MDKPGKASATEGGVPHRFDLPPLSLVGVAVVRRQGASPGVQAVGVEGGGGFQPSEVRVQHKDQRVVME